MHTCQIHRALTLQPTPPKALGHMQDPSKDVSFRPKKCIPVQIHRPLTLQQDPSEDVSFRPKKCIPVQIHRPLTLQPIPPRLWAICKTPQRTSVFASKMHTCPNPQTFDPPAHPPQGFGPYARPLRTSVFAPKKCRPVQIHKTLTLQPTPQGSGPYAPQRTSVFATKNAYLSNPQTFDPPAHPPKALGHMQDPSKDVSLRPKKCRPVQIHRPLTLQPTPLQGSGQYTRPLKGRQLSPQKMHTCPNPQTKYTISRGGISSLLILYSCCGLEPSLFVEGL